MKRHFLTAALLAACMTLCAQTRIATNPLYTYPRANVTIPYSYYGEGVSHEVKWGFDTAWKNEQNIRKGVSHMDGQPVDIVRVSFTPWEPLTNGTDLTTTLKKEVDERVRLANFAGRNVPVEINDDHATVDDWYKGKPKNWHALIKATAQRFVSKGHPIETVAPFNEPDYFETGQGSMDDMRNVCRELKNDNYFDTIRISGGNTLNCDKALEWYEHMKQYLDEGNTHQLAGDFDHYADFFQQVRSDNKYATADELHNIMEAFVGAEYGMQTGIWWGSAERARGELMQAMSHGVRLGYGESRPTWMAGAVYRKQDGNVKAFIGQSERQATTTTFAFRTDRPVFYDGQGPLREFYVSVTGGTGYQKGTTGGERVYDVHCSEDVPPVIEGKYFIVNRASGHYCLETETNNSGQQLRVYRYTGKTSQQWEMHQLTDYQKLNDEKKSLRGGDYSYHSMIHVASGKAPDVENWSLNAGAKIMLWDSTLGSNQVYYLQYDNDGYFRLINQESNLCLQASKTGNGANVVQGKRDDSNLLQQWRFVPVGVKPEFVAPAAPANINVTPQSASLFIEWETVEDDNTLAGYNLLRSTAPDAGFEIVARGLTTTAFVDHEAKPGVTYYYKVRATDTSCNTGEASAVVSGTIATTNSLVAAWGFNKADSLYDATPNLNNIVTGVKPVFSSGKIGESLYLNGSTQWAQLPYGIAPWEKMTFTAWVKWSGGGAWQRIFDFGNDTDHYMFLSPSNGSNMVFAIKNGAEEERLTSPKLSSNRWVHVAVTIGSAGVTVYVDGEAVASSSSITARPSDFCPAFNYLGRSQFASDPLMKGYIDDVRIYNYALTGEEVAAIASMTDAVESVAGNTIDTPAYDLQGRNITTPRHGQVFIKNGKKNIKK